MQTIPIQEQPFKLWHLLLIIPALAVFFSMLVAFACWAEIRGGQVPMEVPLFFWIGAGVGAVTAAFIIVQSKNVYFYVPTKMLYFTRPYLSGREPSKTMIGRPLTLRVEADFRGKRRVYLVHVQCQLEGSKKSHSLLFASKDEAYKAARHLSHISGAQFLDSPHDSNRNTTLS